MELKFGRDPPKGVRSDGAMFAHDGGRLASGVDGCLSAAPSGDSGTASHGGWARFGCGRHRQCDGERGGDEGGVWEKQAEGAEEKRGG